MSTENQSLFAMMEGAAAAQRCEDKAARLGWDADAAGEFMVQYLEAHGETPGETLVSEANKVYMPHDARAFGSVILRLKRAGRIEHCGYCRRKRGHGTHGWLIWRVVNSLK